MINPAELGIEQIQTWGVWILSGLQEYTPKALGALLVLVIGIRLIRWGMRLIKKGLAKAHVDNTVSTFLISIASILLKIVLLLSVASMFGVKTTSFIALLGAAGLAVGLSLQGSLSNFAGGVLILLFKPYKVGDLIEIQGIKGHVQEISVLTTTLLTLEHNHAFIPNGPIINNNIMNFSKKGSIRVDIQVNIAYNQSIDTAREVLLEMCREQNDLLDDPSPEVLVHALGDSSLHLLLRVYVLPEHYWPVYFRLTEYAKKSLDKAHIEIPFPQRVVHMSS